MYAETKINIKAKYGLGVTSAERSALQGASRHMVDYIRQ
jgi:hypothetical protein